MDFVLFCFPFLLFFLYLNIGKEEKMWSSLLSLLPPSWMVTSIRENHRKKSMSFWNISRRTPAHSKRSLMLMSLPQPNHPAHLPQKTLSRKYWKSRRHSQISQIRRSSKFKKSWMTQITNLNWESLWPLRVPWGNKLSFQWTMISLRNSSRIQVHMLSTSIELSKRLNLAL